MAPHQENTPSAPQSGGASAPGNSAAPIPADAATGNGKPATQDSAGTDATGNPKPAGSGEHSAERPGNGPSGTRKQRKRWQPQPPKQIPFSFMLTVALGGILAVALIVYLVANFTLPMGGPAKPRLDGEFEDPHNDYTIRLPRTWRINDPHDKTNIFILGPSDPEFRPMVIVSLEIRPGHLASFLPEHKARMKHEDQTKSLKWISEEPDSIDGCPATMRMEYDCDVIINDKPVKTRTLQYIMEDRPRFYRITCHAKLEHYEDYLPYFEAIARSFKRNPLRAGMPRILSE